MLSKKILTIVSGAPSGALNIAVTLANYFGDFDDSKILLRKYNKANLKSADVVKDIFVVDYIFNLYKKLKKIKPDIIIAHGYSTHLWTKIAAAFDRIPLIHVEHNVERYTGFRRWLLQYLDRYTLAYVCVSHGVAKHLIEQGIDGKKINVIYNGIDIVEFQKDRQPQPHFTVGMTARFSKQKDQLTLIKAVEYVVNERKIPIRLILQGSGKQKERCMLHVEEKKLGEIVTFEVGRLSDLTPRLDLFVLATHYEGFGLVICEAMAAKVPTIATNVPGVDEIIEHAVDGYLVPHEDYLKLAKQIELCYENRNKEVMNKITSNAFIKVNEKFNLIKMCQQYKKTIDKYTNRM